MSYSDRRWPAFLEGQICQRRFSLEDLTIKDHFFVIVSIRPHAVLPVCQGFSLLVGRGIVTFEEVTLLSTLVYPVIK